MKEKTLLPFGVGLIPRQSDSDRIVALHEKIHALAPSEFILQRSGNLLPHVSVFQGVFNAADEESIWDHVHAAFNGLTVLGPIATIGLAVWATKIFFFDLQKNGTDLQLFHDRVFSALNGLRNEEAGSADPQNFVGISADEEFSFQRYGYPFALTAFRPHFTLGRCEGQSEALDIVTHLQQSEDVPKSVTFESLVLFEVGKFGRLERVVREVTR